MPTNHTDPAATQAMSVMLVIEEKVHINSGRSTKYSEGMRRVWTQVDRSSRHRLHSILPLGECKKNTCFIWCD